jgi:hypothetical protein
VAENLNARYHGVLRRVSDRRLGQWLLPAEHVEVPRCAGRARRNCPRRKPPFWAVKRPARPYKSPIQNRF